MVMLAEAGARRVGQALRAVVALGSLACGCAGLATSPPPLDHPRDLPAVAALPLRAVSAVSAIDPASPVLDDGVPLVSPGVTVGNPTVGVSNIGGMEWAVYAAGGYDAAHPPYTFRLDLSGSNGQVWLGIADFVRETWRWQALEAPFNFGNLATVPAPADCFRPADGTVFLVLLAYNGSKLSFRGGNTGGYQVETLYVPEAGASAQNPQYEPIGQYLVFTNFHNGYNTGPAGLYKLDLSGMTPNPFFDEPGVDNVNTNGSAWNAATTRIAFSSDRGGAKDIWVIPELGGEPEQVTDHPALPDYLAPTFSPDGYTIVFESRQGTTSDIATVKVQLPMDDPQLLVFGGAYDNRHPVWSPLGAQILFQRRKASMAEWNLYTMNTSGGDITQFTSGDSDTGGTWSSDARWVVFSSAAGGLAHPNIFIVSALGGAPTRVTFDDTRAHTAPCFSPDEHAIVFEVHTTADDASPTFIARVVLP